MKKCYYLALFASVTVGLTCCCPILEVDPQIVQEKIYGPSVTKHPVLGDRTVLYFDQSTCMMRDYRNASEVFVALRPQLGQYCDTMLLMQGSTRRTLILSRDMNVVSEALEQINSDIPYTDIRGAIFRICNSDQQAILITDCESWFVTQQGQQRNLDLEAYMSEPFRNWLRKGYSIYMVIEPYQERWQGNLYDKKRFYFIFTDDKLDSPISNNLLGQLAPLRNRGLFTEYKLTNADIYAQRVGDMIDNNLSFTYKSFNGFDYVAIDDDWKSIREYVMKLDKYGNPFPEDEPAPLIKNIYFEDGYNYRVRDVEIVATNITSQYVALEDSTVTPIITDMSHGFRLDKDALQSNELKVFLTEKIFDHLTDEYGGNLIRLDFAIKEIDLEPFDTNMFTWQSLFNNGQAICVSQSIENALVDIEVLPHRAKNRRIIYTVFIKTEKYKP